MKPHLWLIKLSGVIVPRTFRADWQREWESELRFRERQLAEWDRLDGRARLDLLKRSAAAFWDALWLQRRRLSPRSFRICATASGSWMGIRLAHGAQPTDLLKLIVGHGLTLTTIGLGAGLAAAFGVTRLTRGVLFGVSPTDPLTFAAIPMVLLAVASLASAIPAWQATRLDPVASLRSE